MSDATSGTEAATPETDVPEAEPESELETSPSRPEGKISFESSMDLGEAVAYFEAVVAGLKKGAIQFRRGDQNLDLTPVSPLRVKLKAASKGKREKIEVELSWSPEQLEGGELEIS